MKVIDFIACVTLLVWQPCCTGRFVEGDKPAALADSGTEDKRIKNNGDVFAGYDYAGAYGTRRMPYNRERSGITTWITFTEGSCIGHHLFGTRPHSAGVVSVIINRSAILTTNEFHKKFYDDCSMDIKVPSSHFISIAFYYVYITDSCADYVEVIELTSSLKPIRSSKRICGKPGYVSPSKDSPFVFDTAFSSGIVRINLHQFNSQSVDFNDAAAGNFFGYNRELIRFNYTYTVYNMSNAGSCGSPDLFLCLNSHCISKRMVCDGWNNCGDGSDESPYICLPQPSKKPRHSIGTYIGIVVGSLFLFIACVLVIIPGKRRLRFCGRDRTGNRRATLSSRRSLHRRRSRRRRESNISTISGSDTFFLSSQNSSLSSYDNPSYEAEMPPSYDEAIRTTPIPMTSPFSFSTSDPPRAEPTPTSQSSVNTSSHRTTITPQDCASFVPSAPTQSNNDNK